MLDQPGHRGGRRPLRDFETGRLLAESIEQRADLFRGEFDVLRDGFALEILFAP